MDANVVNLAVEYLDQCNATGRKATLVGMYWYIDGRNKTMPLVEEVNEALNQRLQMRVSRERTTTVFSPEGKERAVSAQDMRNADKQYREEFWAEYRRLRQ